MHIEPKIRYDCYDIFLMKMIHVHTSSDVQIDRVADTLSNFIPYTKSIMLLVIK